MNLGKHSAWNRSWLVNCTRHFGGDPAAQPTGESTAQMMQAWIQNFPQFLDVSLKGLQPAAQAQLGANQSTSLPQAQLQADIFKQIGPQVNQTGNDINRMNALAQNETDKTVLQNSSPLIQTAYDQSQIFDKPYYDTRDAMAKQYQSLLGGMDPNALSGAERAQTERGLAQQGVARGTSTSPSNIEAMNAASQFGDKLTAKRSALTSALQTANQFLEPAKSGVDTFKVATGKASTPNQGAAQIPTANTSAGSSALDLSNSLMGQVGGLQQQTNSINANRRDTMDRAVSVLDGY